MPNAPVVVVPEQWCIPKKLLKRYGQTNMEHLHGWWLAEGISMLRGDSPLVFISGLQLFFAFNIYTGFEGPWCHRKKWYAAAEMAPEAARLNWGQRCKWFLLMLGSYLKGNSVVVPNRMTRPASSALAKWVICYRMHWPQSKIEMIDREFFAQLGRQAVTKCDIGQLSAAKTG